MFTLCRVAVSTLGFVLLALIIWAAFERPIGESFAEIIADPWGLVAMVDLYLGFILFAVIVVLIEKKIVPSVLWVLPIFFLGNIWTALWLVLRLPVIYKKLRADYQAV